MPNLSLPEIRLKSRLPEGLRDMSADDIQSAIGDVRAPKLELPKVDLPKVEMPHFDFDLGREAGRAAKRADKAAKRARKSAGREASKAARAVENVLPRRKGPNPVPVAILAMLGGVVVGWLLAVNPVTGPRISAMMDSARRSWDGWRGRDTDTTTGDWDTTDAQAYPASLATSFESETTTGTLDTEPGLDAGTAGLSDDMGTTHTDQIRTGNGTGA